MAPVWFADPKAKARLVEPVDDLLSSNIDWALRVADIPSDSKAATIARRNAVSVYRSTKQDVQAQIDVLKDTPSSELTVYAHNAIEIANISKSKWAYERQTSPAKKAGALFQASMTTFSLFLENFSGLAEIAKGADQQYGGLAYGTLSLMLSVFVHKTRREQALDEGFEELGLSFPRLQTLQNLRGERPNDDHQSFQRLEALMMSTFCLVVKFARETAEYYKSKTERVKDIFRPAEVKNKTMIDIRKSLSEIRYECDILMLTRITSLQQQIGEMSIGVEATRVQSVETGRQISRAKQSSDIAHLADLRQILGIQEPSKYTDLEAYKSLLSDAFFSGNSLRSKQYRPRSVSIELLRGEGEFEQWWESKSSSLLLAGGSNFGDDYTLGSLNWLSYGAVLAVEELRLQNKKVAFFFAQTSLNMKTRGKRCSSQTIIATLIYQIAEMHHSLLRGQVDKLKGAVQGPAWTSGDAEVFISTVRHLLLEIFSAFPGEDEIFIVVDRLDQCAWEAEGTGECKLDLRHTIEALLRVAVEANCNVKVLLTVDAASSRKLARAQIVLPKKERKALLLKAEWCQATDDGRPED